MEYVTVTQHIKNGERLQNPENKGSDSKVIQSVLLLVFLVFNAMHRQENVFQVMA